MIHKVCLTIPSFVQNNVAGIQSTIDRLITPRDDSLDEKCARIKRFSAGIIPEYMAKWYAIGGEREKRIELSGIVVQYEIEESSR